MHKSKEILRRYKLTVKSLKVVIARLQKLSSTIYCSIIAQSRNGRLRFRGTFAHYHGEMRLSLRLLALRKKRIERFARYRLLHSASARATFHFRRSFLPRRFSTPPRCEKIADFPPYAALRVLLSDLRSSEERPFSAVVPFPPPRTGGRKRIKSVFFSPDLARAATAATVDRYSVLSFPFCDTRSPDCN